MSDKMFPLQTSRRKGIVPGPTSIPWSVAEKAYGAYAREHGRGQSLERLAERGGFGWCEMDDLYPAWRDEVSEITALRSQLAARDQELAEACRLLRRAEDEVPVGMPTFTAIQKFLTRHQARKETT